MISNIELTSDDDNDENYAIVFKKERKERFLTLGEKPKQEIKLVLV